MYQMDNGNTVNTATTKNIDKSYLFGAQTNYFQSDPSIAAKCHESAPNAVPVLLTCSKTTKTTIGRGHDATVKIGKANKRVSREHVVIEHKPPHGYEMTVLSPNGALIDHIVFVEGEHVPLKEGTMIEILGTRLIFKGSKEEEELVVQQEEVKTNEKEQGNGMEQDKEQIKQVIITDKSNKKKIKLNGKEQKKEEQDEGKKENIIKKEEDIPIENVKVPTKSNRNKKPKKLEDEIIRVLVYTRKSTMSCADILRRLEGELLDNVYKVLTSSPGIGCIKRLGKTADGSPKEDLYYYKPDLDPDLERRKKYSEVGRSARKCTMKDTQYFFRIPPKLPHRSKANNQKRKSNNATPLKKSEAISDADDNDEDDDDDDDIKSNSSGDVSDMEVYELFKDVQ